MTPDSMRIAIDKIKADVCALIEEKAEIIIRDMADSFVQQAAEDEDKKPTFPIRVSVKVKPLDNETTVDIGWGVKKTARKVSKINE